MRDVALTDDELANQLRLLLQPWDRRGILTIILKYGTQWRLDPEESVQIKDIALEEIHSDTHGAEGVGDETSHVEHVECTGHAEEDEAGRSLGEHGAEKEG